MWIAAIPIGITIAAVLIGVPQVRELRRITGDRSLLTSILGFTLR